jgi:hypothetical protein
MSSPTDARRTFGLDIHVLRELYATRPQEMPKVFAHRNSSWVTAGGAIASAKIDNKGNLHMSEAYLVVLKQMLPVKEIGRVREDVTEFAFDLGAHHLIAGLHDRRPVLQKELRKAGLREALGHDGFGRRRKVEIAGRLH